MKLLTNTLFLAIGLLMSFTPPCKYDVTKIAGKTEQQIQKMFGRPTEKTTVKPSRTPCPCPKRIYQDGTLEIVYMKGKADWITINVDQSCNVNTGNLPAQRFEDYVYVKAFTR